MFLSSIMLLPHSPALGRCNLGGESGVSREGLVGGWKPE